MLRRSVLIALAATAAIGVLIATAADAGAYPRHGSGMARSQGAHARYVPVARPVTMRPMQPQTGCAHGGRRLRAPHAINHPDRRHIGAMPSNPTFVRPVGYYSSGRIPGAPRTRPCQVG